MTQVNLLNLTKRYPSQPAPVLKDFSLFVENGELVALLGPSGSGKSTLLKLITGIERPDAGDVQFDSVSILTLPPSQRGAVFMFQKSYLFPFLSVEENIGFGLKVKHVPANQIRRDVGQMLDLIGLPGIEKRKPAQLSGGEQQRVALARALMNDPQAILADEPTGNLDGDTGRPVLEHLFELTRRREHSLVMVTHNERIAGACDRVLRLRDGSLSAQTVDS